MRSGFHSRIPTDDVLVFAVSAAGSVHGSDAVDSCTGCITAAQSSLADDNCASSKHCCWGRSGKSPTWSRSFPPQMLRRFSHPEELAAADLCSEMKSDETK